MTRVKFKNDKYKKSRGGFSRLLDIQCSECTEHLFFYQKDGPGILKRMYLDRIYESKKYSNLENQPLKSIPKLTCPKCNILIGIPYIYKMENRFAFRLFAGSVIKKIIKSK
jgi:hypothetical protein